MTFVPDSINKDYQYIWSSLGLEDAPIQQQEIQIPIVTQDVIPTGEVGSFTFLRSPQGTSGIAQPNSVFGQTTAPKVSQEITNPITSTKPEADTTIAFKKTGESFDEKMSRYYTKYKNASSEEQEKLEKKYITQHYASLKDKSRAEQIRIQLADFKKMLSNTRDPEVRERLVIRIQDLEKENQILAAQTATVDEKDAVLKKSGEMGVAKSLHKYHNDNQIAATKIVVESKNEDAILEGSMHASELDKDNQVGAVNIYKTADISKKAKLELGERLVDQYKEFDVSNQTDIHKIMSDKKYWDEKTVVYAASNIYQLDKTNQAQAIQITSDTKIEAAIQAAAKNYQYYDKDVQESIKSIIYNNSDCKPANETSTSSVTGNENLIINYSSYVTAPASMKEETALDKFNELTKSGTDIKPNELEEILKNASDVEKSTILKNSSGSPTVIKALLASNPSKDLMDEILAYLNEANLSDKDQNELIGMVSKSGVFKGANSKLSLMNPQFQQAYITQLSPEGLQDINKDDLTAIAKDTYEKRMIELKKNDTQKKFGLLIG